MAVNIGPRVIAEITRQDSTLPLEARLPVSYPGWKHAAKEILPPGVFAYIACGAEAGETMAANRAAFADWRIRPRALASVAEREIGITLFGRLQTGPLVLASAGNQGLINPEGDLASARAAAALGLPFALSTLSSYSIEQVAQVSGEGMRWFQLYGAKTTTSCAAWSGARKRPAMRRSSSPSTTPFQAGVRATCIIFTRRSAKPTPSSIT